MLSQLHHQLLRHVPVFRRSSGPSLSSAKRKHGILSASSWRHYCQAKEAPSTPYKPSYDPRKVDKLYNWPKNRKEELVGLAKEVHPDATLREADPNNFSFRVRVDERIQPPSPDDYTEPAAGKLKPVPIMRGVDNYAREQRKKRAARRNELLLSLSRDQPEENALTPSEINRVFDELKELDLQEAKDGFEPVYFSKTQLFDLHDDTSASSSPFPSPTSKPPKSSTSTVKLESSHAYSDKIGVYTGPKSWKAEQEPNTEATAVNWTLATTASRRRFLADIERNLKDHQEAGERGVLDAAVRLGPPRTTLDIMNDLTLKRAFGLVVQTALVLPLAIARLIGQLVESPDNQTSKLLQKDPLFRQNVREWVEASIKEREARIQEIKEYERQAREKAGWPVRIARLFVVLPFQAMAWSIRFLFWYPVRYLGKGIGYLLKGVYTVAKGMLQLAIKFFALFSNPSRPWLYRPVHNLYFSVAPHSWTRYYLGDPLGTLWDRNTGHAEEVLKASKNAFHDLSYSVERWSFAIFHSNRLIGLALLGCAAVITASMGIEPDPNTVSQLFAELRQL